MDDGDLRNSDRAQRLAVLYQKHAGEMQIQANRLLRDGDLAWDAVHSVFLRLARSKRILHDVACGYLMNAVRNECRSFYRRSTHELPLEGIPVSHLPITEPAAAGDDDGIDVLTDLHARIVRLTGRQRKVME